MKNLILLSLFVSFQASAACTYKLIANSQKVSWKAYKTPKKVGVDGEFKKFTLTPKVATSSSVDELLASAKFDIDAGSVSTANPDRDKKIVTNFFHSNGKAIAISGEVSKVEKDGVHSKLTIDGSTKDVVFTKIEKDNTVRLEAVINVLDFNLKPNLERITAACKALHEGITWPDVNVAVDFQVEKICK